MVAQFPPAEFAQSQHHEAARLPGVCTVCQVRHAKPLGQRLVLQRRYLDQDRLRQVAQGRGGLLDGILAENVAHADAEQFLVLETVQDRLDIGGTAAKLRQLAFAVPPQCAAG